VVAVFRQTVADQGIPASVLSDNGMVFTTRFAGGRAGRDTINGFQAELRDLGVVQKHSKPNHPTTCGKVERFHQTLKKWLTAQPQQPQTLAELQAPRETHLGLAGQLAQRLERVPLRQRRHIAQVASGCTAEQRESLIGGHLLGWSTPPNDNCISSRIRAAMGDLHHDGSPVAHGHHELGQRRFKPVNPHQGALISTRTLPEISEFAASANASLTSSSGST
jgi:hypothetical protein